MSTSVITCLCGNLAKIEFNTVDNAQKVRVRCFCGFKTKYVGTIAEAVSNWNSRRLVEK